MSEATSSAAAPTGDGGAAANGPENGTVAAASNEVASGTQGMQASIPAAPEMKQTLGESKAQADARRKFKFKVDGAEVEEELSDTDVHVRLQKAMAVEKRFQEVANQRKQIEEALKTIKSDPAKALKELAGIDLDEWAEQRLTERYQEAMMPEEQRELAALKKKIADYEAREEEAKAAAQRTQYEAFEQQVYEQTQQEFIKARNERHAGRFANVKADASTFDDPVFRGAFDVILSCEMLEHMKNYDMVLSKVSSWLKPDGRMVVQILGNRRFAYDFNTTDWMGKYFFAGGTMPSRDLFEHFLPSDLRQTKVWDINGREYAKTLDTWLERLDANRKACRQALEGGPTSPSVALERWRMFLLFCSEVFGYRDGNEWMVFHYLFEKA